MISGELGPLTTSAMAMPENDLGSPVPRFVGFARPQLALNLTNSRTRLLFPFVTALHGADTAISISNVSRDPFRTINQTGLCSIHFYGWIDNVRVDLSYPSPSIVGGEHFAWTLSSGGAVTATPGFQGYIIAQCDFPARGFATILHSENGTTGGYLAEVLNDE